MNTPLTSEGGRDDRGVPYHAESTLSSAQMLKYIPPIIEIHKGFHIPFRFGDSCFSVSYMWVYKTSSERCGPLAWPPASKTTQDPRYRDHDRDAQRGHSSTTHQHHTRPESQTRGDLLRSRACAGLLFAFFYSLLSSRSRPTRELQPPGSPAPRSSLSRRSARPHHPRGVLLLFNIKSGPPGARSLPLDATTPCESFTHHRQTSVYYRLVSPSTHVRTAHGASQQSLSSRSSPPPLAPARPSSSAPPRSGSSQPPDPCSQSTSARSSQGAPHAALPKGALRSSNAPAAPPPPPPSTTLAVGLPGARASGDWRNASSASTE